MVIIAVNNSNGKKIAFTNNSDARDRLKQRNDIEAVLILGKYDLGFPDTSVKTTELNQKDGLVVDNVKYTKRLLEFNTNFPSNSEIEISRTRQKLAGVINSQQTLITLEFYRNNNFESDSELFYLREVVGRISYESRDGQRLTSSQNCVLQFTAYSPLFETPEKTQVFNNSIAGQGKIYPFVYPFTYDSVEGTLGEINNKGDVPTPFIAIFSGVLNASSLQKLDEQSNVIKEIKLKAGVTIPDTEVFAVNTKTRTATLDGVNAFEKLDPITRFYNLDAGRNTLKFLAGNNNANNRVELTWIEKYISI